ncbi:D-alanyl-D-alanine carboxypeptidase [Promicromonospora sp. AC04]|uniref:serine hydrolase domain-containing protein n=1 Tax=Promicromonospora sp. AC04 TaxID=2135723 RepID=UPI000D40496A|nr:serine hydrolase domain-containing protein [Promicromonospora sp. AC04]PUB30324.1 D-alanyl-D-alanine carboxypeptidase [Promicromonospora sp. AC04]
MSASRRVRAALSVVVAGSLPLTGAGVATTAQAAPSATAVSAAPSHVPSAADDPMALSQAVREAAERAAAAPGLRARTTDAGVRDDLDRAVAGLVDDGAVAVTARVETPDLTWAGADGVRELGGHVPARPKDQFRVASITKPMIATLVMQEIEKGTWSLDTSVEDVLPGALPRDVTIEQLLSHTSGAPTATDYLLVDHMTDPASFDEFFEVLGEHYSEGDHVRAVHTAPWVLEPGTGFSYSNAGFVTLGMMLEKVTGEDLDDLLEERVFEPAGMRHSAYPERPGTRGPFLDDAAYTGAEGAGWYSIEHFDPTVFRAAGAVTSTTSDLAAFTEALVTGDLVDPATVTDMLTPRTTDGLGYGLGAYRLPDPCVPGEYLYGHDGGTYGTISLALTSLDGERQLSMGVTGRNVSADPDALYDLSDLLVPLLEATC